MRKTAAKKPRGLNDKANWTSSLRSRASVREQRQKQWPKTGYGVKRSLFGQAENAEKETMFREVFQSWQYWDGNSVQGYLVSVSHLPLTMFPFKSTLSRHTRSLH